MKAHIVHPLICSPLRDRGFALIVTLSLMILLSILAVGMISLSSIQLRGISREDSMREARSNARLALALALGQLQKEMGLDQRISAPGGQLLPAGDKSAGNHWTGVYESWKEDTLLSPEKQGFRPAPTFRRWLLSGAENVVTDRASAENGTSVANETVSLVAGDSQNDPVLAGLVPTESGACAWWIADENTKAKLGNRVEQPADAKEALARMQAAPRAAHEMIVGSTVALDSPDMTKLVTTGSLENIGATTPYFHHATVHSTGLLTNVRSGGLRKDLSFYLEKPLAEVNKSALYTAGTAAGYNFFELWRDYNVWGEIQYPSTPPVHADGRSIPSGTPFITASTNRGTFRDDPFFIYKHPTKLQTAILCSLIVKKVQRAGKTQYDIYVVNDSMFTIWNPSNVAMHIPGGDSFLTFKTWSFPYDLTLNMRNGSRPDQTVTNSINSALGGANNYWNAMLGKSQTLVLRPGEVQIQSQGFNSSAQTGFKWVDAKIGWDFGTGFENQFNYGTPARTERDSNYTVTYSLAPNTDNSLEYSLYNSGYSIGSVDGPAGNVHVGTHVIDYSEGKSPKISAIDYPQIFPTLPEDPSARKTLEELSTGDKWPICIFTFGMKTALDAQFDAIPASGRGTRGKGRAMLRFNPGTNSYDLGKLEDGMVRASPLQVGMRKINSLSDLAIECDLNGLGYYGASYSSRDGVSQVIGHSLATEPMISLGAFQNSFAEGVAYLGTTNATKVFQAPLPSIQHAISNSFAPSVMASDKVISTIAGRNAADHSYLTNLALWDDWFFSSIAPQTAPAYKSAGAYAEQKSRLENFLKQTEALPNSRFLPSTGYTDEAVKKIFPTAKPATDAHQRSASLILVDGMFNVNSTSVPAWKAFLAGLKESSVPVRDVLSGGKEPDLVSTTKTPVTGLLTPGGGEIPDNTLADPKSPEQWVGFRALSDTQIDELATAIVKQVRLRGPFTSLADFVNRRPGTNTDLALSGALQSALDDEDVSINASFRQGERSLSLADTAGFEFPEAEAGPKDVGSPGYVKQADLLTPLGPLISVRGDTFLIRAYGESRDETGKLLARAWCESTVRRVPEYVDPADEPHIASPTSGANRSFGRKFETVTFRWLSPEEIL